MEGGSSMDDRLASADTLQLDAYGQLLNFEVLGIGQQH
jgi:hypothetical protein